MAGLERPKDAGFRPMSHCAPLRPAGLCLAHTGLFYAFPSLTRLEKHVIFSRYTLRNQAFSSVHALRKAVIVGVLKPWTEAAFPHAR